MGINQHDYHTDVNLVLDGKQPELGNSLRFGAEVETGWHSIAKRNEFFDMLNEVGIDKVAISKFDRSIADGGAAEPSEIVTKPLSGPKIGATLETIGGVVESLAEHVTTKNCGVHIHASEAAMSMDVQWRVVTAIHQDPRNTASRWLTANGKSMFTNQALASATKKFDEESVRLHTFWTMLALRKPGKYSGRTDYGEYGQFKRSKGRHQNAVILGAHTPTIEFRLFKTPRSKTVLRSYSEIVSSLIAFAENAPAHCLTLEQPVDPGWRDPMPEINAAIEGPYKQAMIRYYEGHNVQMQHQLNWGLHAIDITHQFISYIKQGVPWVVFAQDYARQFPENEYNRLAAKYQKHLLAMDRPLRHWATMFPVDEYAKYVLDNPRQYPALASRLKLAKFQELLTGVKSEVASQDTTPFPEAEPHAKIRAGCIVSQECDPSSTLLRVGYITRKAKAITAEDVIVTTNIIRVRGNCPANEVYREGGEFTITGDEVIHRCPGALTKGGHDE